MRRQLVLTCEHAGNEVPEKYRHLFEGHGDVLQTHRGIDIGALELTNTISRKMKREAYLHTITRLLVDLNRSVRNPTLFSEFTRDLPDDIRQQIFEEYYRPHRNRVEAKIKKIIAEGNQVIHLGVHTFTPIWEGKEREVDVGFLYDPQRKGEKRFCQRWRRLLAEHSTELRLKMNQPYKGTMDGFTTYLRKEYDADHYIGMEIEVNQRFVSPEKKEQWARLQQNLADTFKKVFLNIQPD